MKAKLVVMSLVLSFQAYSCPNLEGVYISCKSESMADVFNVSKVTVKQTRMNEFSLTLVTSEGEGMSDVIADGSTSTIVQESPEFGEAEMSRTASCTPEKLVIADKLKTPDFEIHESTEYELKNASLTMTTFLEGEKVNTITCLREK